MQLHRCNQCEKSVEKVPVVFFACTRAINRLWLIYRWKSSKNFIFHFANCILFPRTIVTFNRQSCYSVNCFWVIFHFKENRCEFHKWHDCRLWMACCWFRPYHLCTILFVKFKKESLCWWMMTQNTINYCYSLCRCCSLM